MIQFSKSHVTRGAGFLLLSLGVFTACDNGEPVEPEALEVATVQDVPADPDAERGAAASYTFFDLDTGTILSKSDSATNSWDLAFAGTSILINGGSSGPGQGSAQIIDGVFDNITEAPETGFVVDAADAPAIPTSGDNSWYIYTGEGGTPAHAILPVPGKVIALTTGEGKYALVEIISYYEGNPDTSSETFADLSTRAASRYFTFQYVVQPDGGRTF